MAEYIKRQDSLNTGRKKINAELTKANENASSARSISNQANSTASNALNVANQADGKANDTQQQLDDIILDDGTGNAEVIQARNGEPLLKDRLNKTDTKLAETYESVPRNALFPIPMDTYDGSGQAVHPDYLRVPGGWNGYEHWMVYTPYPYNDESLENPSIARSHDGVNWSTPAGLTNPIDQPTQQELSERTHLSDGIIFLNGNIMECWYRYVNRDKELEQYYRKTSSDGENWSERELVYNFDPTVNKRYGVSPTVILEDGKYKMWYVSGPGDVYYTESKTANPNDWSKEVLVPLNWIVGDVKDGAWHIDVKKFEGKYHITFCTWDSSDGRRLAWGSSSDGKSFNDVQTILRTSGAGFDNKSLYRCSLGKLDSGDYVLYYSARSQSDYWSIGMLSGKNINTMKGVLPLNRYGNLLISKVVVQKELNLNIDKLALKNKNAFFQQDELRFDTPGEKQVKLVNIDNKILELRPAGNSWVDGIFRAHTLQSTQTRTQRIYPPGSYGLVFNGITRYHTSEEDGTDPWIKMLRQGTGGAGLQVHLNNTLDVVRDNGDLGGHLRAGSIICDGNSTSVEGEIRYNKSTKKHQGYDGSTWHNLY